ncbi:MAG: TOBE domain-containing protein, partial [Planctomycetales bacterium]|nr:TOBE domain-containing protein [Planctomycetales bacterium]
TAGLLGAPPMNFIDGTLTGEDGGVFAASGVWRQWRFSMPLSDWPTGAVGRKAVLGVRPEHVHVHGEAPPGSVGNLAKIVMVEALGDSTILRLQTATNDSDDNVTTTLACRMPARVNLSEGMQAAVSIDAQRCCLFCQETGERLPRRDETT